MDDLEKVYERCSHDELIHAIKSYSSSCASLREELKAGAHLVATVGDKNRELEARIADMNEGRHPCPTCDCPMYHSAKTGWYYPECELMATKAKLAASEARGENLRKSLAEHDIIVTTYPGGGIQIEQGKSPSPYISIESCLSASEKVMEAAKWFAKIHDKDAKRAFDANRSYETTCPCRLCTAVAALAAKEG